MKAISANNPPAVLLGGGVIAVSTARALRSEGIPVVALGDSKADTVRGSRHCARFVDVGSGAGVEERFMEWLTSECAGAVVVPCSDDALSAVARSRSTLESRGHHVPEAKDEIVLAMLDKERAYELARRAGFATPRTRTIRSEGDLSRAEEIGFPCALKPIHSHLFARHFGGSTKVVVAHDFDQLRSAFDTISSFAVDVVLTEIIPGGDDDYHSVLTYIAEEEDAPLFLVTKRKLRQYPPEFGLGTYHVTDWNPQVADLAVALARSIGLIGVANFEFKRDARDGQFKLIECNHRLTITSELVRLAGINSAKIVYDRSLGRPTQRYGSYRRGVRLLLPTEDMRASLGQRRNGDLTLASWLRSMAHAQHLVVFRWTDPAPAILGAAIRARRVGGRGLARLTRAAQTTGRAEGRRDASVDPRRLTRGVIKLAGRGRVGRELAVRIDMLRATGPGHASRRALELAWRRASPSEVDVIPDVYRRIWADAARELGATLVDLPDGVLEIRNGASSTRVVQKAVGLYNEHAVALAHDKAHVHRILNAAGLPTPEFCEFDIATLTRAFGLLGSNPGPWVVKPAFGAGGYGVTCGVRTADDLARAAVRASRHAARLLLERQVTGDFYRFLVLEGEVLGVVRRRPPRVTGDGRSTVEKLIFAANRRRAQARVALQPIRIDLDCMLTLEAAGLSLDTVVSAGREVVVKSVVSQNSPRDNEIVREPIAGAVVADVVQAVQLLDLRLAGVDLITPTLTESLRDCGGRIIEVNGAPGLHYHYEVAVDEEADRVAIPILRKLLAERTSIGPSERDTSHRNFSVQTEHAQGER